MSLDKYAISPEQAQSIITQATAPKEGKKDYNDPRFWKPSIRDPKDIKDQRPEEYQALVRILPRGFDVTKPFSVQQKEHFFKENSIWFSKKCRLTLGDKEACPVCDSTWKIWNLAKETRDDNLKAKAKTRMPKESYICNVYIIKDVVNPGNDGKVMLWKLTKNMYDIIVSAMKPSQKKVDAFGDESQQSTKLDAFIPYDVINGKNLVVHLTRDAKTGIPSYNTSYWHKPENGPVPLAKTEEEIDNILKDCNDLMEFISDVPTVDALIKDLATFQGKMTTQFPGQPEGYNPVFIQPATGVPAAIKPPVGNPQDLFGNTTLKPMPNVVPTAPVAAPTPTPVPQEVQVVNTPIPLKNEASSAQKEEDELPF